MSNDEFIDQLLDEAAIYAQTILDQDDDEELPPPLNLSSIPKEHLTTLSSIRKDDIIEIREDEKGKGFYAKRNLGVGERLVVSKPLVMVMSFEVESDDEEDMDEDGFEIDADGSDGDNDDRVQKAKLKTKSQLKYRAKEKADQQDDESDSSDPLSEATGTKRNGLILLKTLKSIIGNPSMWTDCLSLLFPRTQEEVLALPPWICSDVSLGMEIERTFEQLSASPSCAKAFDNPTVQEIKNRLALIIRYNVLSMETSSEMFVYPDVHAGGMIGLEGTGLFGPEVSYFNHSGTPNVSRYCIGDVIFFVTNRPVGKGEELCFSYIEHEYLCESPERRTVLLDMDFGEESDDGAKEQPKKRQRLSKDQNDDDSEEEDIALPLIDIDFQNELMATPPLDRLEMITDLLNPQQPMNPNGDDYKCDVYNLHILHAITLENLERPDDAVEEWRECMQICAENFPPVDENIIALHVRMALCAYSSGNKKLMKVSAHHAAESLKMHDLLFGGGVKRFRRRYEKEFLIKMRLYDGIDLKKAADALWPVDK